MGRISVITSGKGGTGKSTFCVGIASAFAKRGISVLLIDLDEGLRCLDLMLGVSENLVFDISDVLSEKTELRDAVLKVNDKISLLAASDTVGTIDYGKLIEFSEKMSDEFDEVILDCPAGINYEFFKALPKFTDVYIVEQLNEIGCRSAQKLEAILTASGIDNKYLIINKFDYFLQKKHILISIDEMMDSSGLMLKGIVPYDDCLDTLSGRGELPFESSAFPAFSRIVDRMMFINNPLPDLKKI